MILAKTNLCWADVRYISDDIVDLCLLTRVGLSVSVPNGIEEARGAADYVTRAEGGLGAVRERVELILKAQNKWDRLVKEYSAGNNEKA